MEEQEDSVSEWSHSGEWCEEWRGSTLEGLESCYYQNLSFSLRDIGASDESFSGDNRIS